MAKSCNKNWQTGQQKDVYTRRARLSGYRSRAIYKLAEIDSKDNLFSAGQIVVDLGAAPGSWSQYVNRKIGQHGRLIAVDILPIDPISNVSVIQGDITEPLAYKQCLQAINGDKVDIIISDMSPNLSGIKVTDQENSFYLSNLVLNFALDVLKDNGDMLVKVFQGKGVDAYRRQLKKYFSSHSVRKPAASRDSSREFYILGRGFKLPLETA